MRSVIYFLICLGVSISSIAISWSNPPSSQMIAKRLFVLPDYYKKYTLSFGDPNAPIKIHKLFSFVCPSCLVFHKHHFPVIQKQFIDTGKVYWTFVPYVMDVDTLYVMAGAAECNDDIKLKIFESIMESASGWIDEDNKERIIQSLKTCGVSDEVIQQTFSETNYESVLRESFDFQNGVTIDGTPTLFINGEEIPGIPGAKKLTKIITDILNSKQGEAQ